MLFNSYDFLFLFLPLTLAGYLLCPARWRNLVLTGAGYIFYGYWNPSFCTLLLGATVLSHEVGKAIHLSTEPTKRRQLLVLAISLNLAALFYFKYANFFLESLAVILPTAHIPVLQVILPIGISFYVFENISYVADVYRGAALPARSLIDYACFLTLFPHLLAGPIVRFQQISEQIHERRVSAQQFLSGIERFILGLSKKVLIADTAAAIADPLFAIGTPDLVSTWVSIIAFSLQIYFDFAGYSDMAIGLAQMFGFTLPENFNFPYQALGISDFWRRWHMSLSAWLRDYVYIPLGGSRVKGARVVMNTLATTLLCGLWHGAAWNYVLWGGYFGVLLTLERPFRQCLQRINRRLILVSTYLLVLVGWVFFKANSIAQAKLWLTSMMDFTGFTPAQLSQVTIQQAFFLGVIQLSCWFWPQNRTLMPPPGLFRSCSVIAMFLACTVVISGKEISPFLYYQF